MTILPHLITLSEDLNDGGIIHLLDTYPAEMATTEVIGVYPDRQYFRMWNLGGEFVCPARILLLGHCRDESVRRRA